MKKILIIIIILCISFFNISCNNNNNEVNDDKDEVITNTEEDKDKEKIPEVNIKDKDDYNDNKIDKEEEESKEENITSVDIKKDTKNISRQWYKAFIEIPIIEGFENKGLEEKINNTIRKDIIDFSNEYEAEGKNAYEESLKYGDMEPRPFNVEISYEIKNNKNGFLSITLLYYYYTGGAHGMSEQVTYNIDINSGEKIKLKDLFIKYYDYVQAINDEIDKQIKEINKEDIKQQIQQGVDEEDIYILFNEFNTISKEQEFYISDNSLVIYFGIYEIAPYAAGIPTFPIDIKVLEQGLTDKAKEYFNL